MKIAAILLAALIVVGDCLPAAAQRPEECEVRRNAAHKWDLLMRDWEDRLPACSEAAGTAQMCGTCADAYETFQDIEHWLGQHIRCKQMVQSELGGLDQFFSQVAASCNY